MARRAEGSDAPRRAPLAADEDGEAPPKLGFVIGPDVPSCTACGTCCFSTMVEYVRVFGRDYDRMDDRAREFTMFVENRCVMRMEGGRCSALGIDPVKGEFLCSIYPMRPDVCRSLERGSGNCLGELATKRERPLLAVSELLKKR